MTPGARLAAAAEILAEISARRSAADRTIAAWGKSHRFAGSKDRAAIAERVYAVLRRRNECAFAMGDDDPRALVIGSLAVAGVSPMEIEALCSDGAHALGALTAQERARIEAPAIASEPWIRLNYPQWLHDELSAAFGANLEAELTALNARAPLDLRANALKTTREAAIAELKAPGLTPSALPQTSTAIRLGDADAKVTGLDAYVSGRVEIQDEASQRAVLLAAARSGETVIDLAAGAGGKSLALASAMQNKGRVFACDVEPLRLKAMEPRVARSGASIIEAAGDPYGERIKVAAGGGADLVFVDAPCSGSGTWRRNPESKWTLDRGRLENYRAAQARLLDRAAELAKPSGRIAYAVCSVLPSEGPEQVAAFVQRRPGWSVTTTTALTPARDGTDGFFLAMLGPRR